MKGIAFKPDLTKFNEKRKEKEPEKKYVTKKGKPRMRGFRITLPESEVAMIIDMRVHNFSVREIAVVLKHHHTTITNKIAQLGLKEIIDQRREELRQSIYEKHL